MKEDNMTTQEVEQAITVKAVEQTLADKIWADIKDVELGLFALEGQSVSKYCTPILVEPFHLYLSNNKGIGAVLPAMEEALFKKYDVEMQDRFIVVSLKKTLPRR
jgi:hypothetical protein